jgi:alkyl sulfatase BDS1-like metallo-beta-lactamase superfamily hydrolase
MKIEKLFIMALALFATLFYSCNEQDNTLIAYDFNAERKNATSFTEEFNNSFYDQLNFDDTSDFADADRGFIAPLINDGNIEGTIEVLSCSLQL